MAEYIEREALLAELAKGTIIPDDLYSMGIMTGVDFAMKKIVEQPAADVVEVVRCKDCRYWDGLHYCDCHKADENGTPIFMREYDFCSYGERRCDE